VADVLARAGGLTESAARTRIQVFRPLVSAGKPRDIEFERLSRLSRSEMTDAEYEIFRTKLASQEATYVLSYSDLYDRANPHDVQLRDADVILVDRETRAVRVDGQVLRPSLVEFAPGRSVDQYLRLAGGPGQRAWLSRVRITRAGSSQTLYSRDVREVEPGDFIWVPEKKDISFWSTFKDVLAVAGAAATIVIVARGH
jgi:protein involved in polysaccharide export with SLBB domain